ncbi:MAG: hypothetical protein HOL02_11030 [Rhodospirillaceae bacterium]|jgi:drug/metabolite transporter (DMT)-like permease|nr:hypothetical protein [Rhodospirillaceae bacterium]MBT6510964.1 hypothetical protein [Rhodospirillaceae bacterium]
MTYRPDQQARLPLPPTLFAMALMLAVAGTGLAQLIAANMTRDPMGAASSMGLSALLSIPVAVVLAIASGEHSRLVVSSSYQLLALRCLAHIGLLLFVFLPFRNLGIGAIFIEFLGYPVAAVIAVLLIHERPALRDITASGLVVAATIGILAFLTWPAVWNGMTDTILLPATVCLATYVVLTRRLAPRDGVACLLFWDSLVTVIFFAGLFGAELVAWDGAPWNQAAGLLLALVAGRVFWIKAYAHAPIARLLPFEFLPLPLLVAVALLFRQTMPPALMLGSALVVPICAGLIWREIVVVLREKRSLLATFD